MMVRSLILFFTAVLLMVITLLPPESVKAQQQNQVEQWMVDLRGSGAWLARGILDGNLIETNFRNHGEFSRFDDRPFGVWPRGSGNRHIDGIGFYISGRVTGERLKWPELFPEAVADTILSPAAHNFRPDAGGVKAPLDQIWGWLPKPNFHNERRIDPITGQRSPTPARSNDPSSWPDLWPDKLTNPDDPGWPGSWNGFFGKGITQADLESYYVIDDYGDKEYIIDPETGELFSPFGVFYPNSQDSTMGGMGLTVSVRVLQWANVLAEDTAFMLYEITNAGDYQHGEREDEGLYFYKVVDYGLVNANSGVEDRGIGAFNPQFDLAFGWDADGIGRDNTGRIFPLGYVGFAFLESPGNPFDGIDNDEDGITDERRDSGPGMLIEGQENIRAFVEANYNMALFEAETNVEDGLRGFGPLEERPAYIDGRWWTGDENLDWVGFEDLNENGVWDEGEPLRDDLGRDGLGPFDFGYEAPDDGEADGIPTPGEPNFDQTDIRESDMIGLRGFDIDDRRVYQNGDNLRNDTWLWNRLSESEFALGTRPDAFEVFDIEPYLLFMSGPVQLPPGRTDFFSLGWLFGDNRANFFRNRETVQNIYNANYRFAQPPIPPTLTAIAGDGRVVLAWDTVSVASFDRFSQEFDFEGYRVYKGTDPLLSDARVITDIDGSPTFFKPLAQFDLINEFAGPVPVLNNTASYDLGSNTGLQFFYIDEDVRNGVRYYYAVVAYDRGVWTDDGRLEVDPQENTFNFSVDAFGNLRSVSGNAALIIPKQRSSGFVAGGANEDLSGVTSGFGTGRVEVEVVDEDQADFNSAYTIEFESEILNPSEYVTRRYTVTKQSTGEELITRPMEDASPLIDGFLVDFFNDEIIEFDLDRSGYVANLGTDNEQFSLNPNSLDGLQTNWIASVELDESTLSEPVPADFELRFSNENVYLPPRFQAVNFLRDSLNVIGVNIDTDEMTELLIVDRNDNGMFDVDDELLIVERDVVFRSRWRVSFQLPPGQESRPPGDGEVLRISNKKPFATGDRFTFTLRESAIDQDKAKQDLDRVAVVPNPYIAASEFEIRTSSVGRSQRQIAFINLPAKCTIRIYNVRGELVNTIERDTTIDDGLEYWDLRTRDRQDVAYGVYVYHVEAPGIGTTTGKFALIK